MKSGTIKTRISPPLQQSKKKIRFVAFLFLLSSEDYWSITTIKLTRVGSFWWDNSNTDIKEFSKLKANGSKLEATQHQAYETFQAPTASTRVPTRTEITPTGNSGRLIYLSEFNELQEDSKEIAL